MPGEYKVLRRFLCPVNLPLCDSDLLYTIVLLLRTGLLMNLVDSGDPSLDFRTGMSRRPSSLRTSDRNSLLRYMGLPLHTFGHVSCFLKPSNLTPQSCRYRWIAMSLQIAGCILSAVSALTADRYAASWVVVGWYNQSDSNAAKGLSMGLAGQCRSKLGPKFQFKFQSVLSDPER